MANQAPVVGSKNVTGTNYAGTAAKVYFTRTIDAAHLIKLYKLINENIFGKVAIKLHTGEKHGPNILPRDMVREF
ncbi:MAG: (Fe-S)-binding protein, partial [Quinella sp. 1Q7]|nr:(Fe-S)-binding protein [Quinella sp. 1Q7]